MGLVLPPLLNYELFGVHSSRLVNTKRKEKGMPRYKYYKGELVEAPFYGPQRARRDAFIKKFNSGMVFNPLNPGFLKKYMQNLSRGKSTQRAAPPLYDALTDVSRLPIRSATSYIGNATYCKCR